MKSAAAASVVLYSGFRPLPRVMGFRQARRWGREHMLWISGSAVAPPLDVPREFQSRRSLRPALSLLLATLGFIALTSVSIAQGKSLANPLGLSWIAFGVLGTVAGVIQLKRQR